MIQFLLNQLKNLKMNKYNISGKISFNIDIDLESDSQNEALQKTLELLKSDHHLGEYMPDISGNVKYDLNCEQI